MPLIVKLGSAKEFAEKTLELSASLNQMLMKMDSDIERVRAMSKVTRVIAEAASSYAGNSDKIVLENETLVAVGVKS